MPSEALITVSSASSGDVQVSVAGVVDPAAVGKLGRLLQRLLASGATSVVVDLTAARRCDCRVLEVLERARQDLTSSGGVLHVRGLDPQVLTGFDAASLPELLTAYRASLGAATRTAPWELGGAQVLGMCSDAARRLAQTCVALAAAATSVAATSDAAASSADAGGRERDGVSGVADRLAEHCVHHLGGHAVVVLRDRTGRLQVASASTERARLLELVGIAGGQGPSVECVRRGELVSVPDLGQLGDRWPRYADAAREHGVAAARALPIRPPPSRAGQRLDTFGALGLFGDHPGPMAPADLGVAQAFADLTAIALLGRPNRAAHPWSMSGYNYLTT